MFLIPTERYVVDFDNKIQFFRISIHLMNPNMKLEEGFYLKKWKNAIIDQIGWISEREMKGVICGRLEDFKVV